jgi:hypothetical protein
VNVSGNDIIDVGDNELKGHGIAPQLEDGLPGSVGLYGWIFLSAAQVSAPILGPGGGDAGGSQYEGQQDNK